MTDVRIQDFNENPKPDANDEFMMIFNNNSENKTRLRDAYYGIVPDGAQTHGNIFRGWNLGALDATRIANIQNNTFKDMFIGDYFSINGSNYVIAAMNYKRFYEDLGNHLVLMPDRFSKLEDGTVLRGNNKDTHFMNDTDTTAGGFANTKLYKTLMPSIQKKLESDFGSHLLKFREVVSTHVNNSGEPDQAEWRDEKVGIPNEVMIYGTTLNGNSQNSAWYNIGDDNTQLPLFHLNHEEISNHRDASFWLRDISSATKFCFASNFGDTNKANPTYKAPGIRAFFLVG